MNDNYKNMSANHRTIQAGRHKWVLGEASVKLTGMGAEAPPRSWSTNKKELSLLVIIYDPTVAACWSVGCTAMSSEST